MISKLWIEAVRTVKRFDLFYKDLVSSVKRDDTDVVDDLLGDILAEMDHAVPSLRGPFYEWYRRAFPLGINGSDPDSRRPRAKLVLGVIKGDIDIDVFMRDLDAYKDALNTVLNKVAPKSFNYQGFKVTNPEVLGEDLVRGTLEGVDFLMALFKKRGVEPLLRAGLTEIKVLSPESMESLVSGSAGLYYPETKVIALSTSIQRGLGRLLLNWVNEVFLHEFGHFVHLGYLSGEAREAWNADWDPYKEAQKVLKFLTEKERNAFFELLLSSKFDLKKASRKLRTPSDKIKFGFWLRNPRMGQPLITPKQFRWTKEGQRLALLFGDPESFMMKEDGATRGDYGYDKSLEFYQKHARSKLGLNGGGSWPIGAKELEVLTRTDPEMKSNVDALLANLGIVSDYGKTNEKEDFAETFVAFMANPSALTPNAKFRMQRALSLSGLYNKPVMKLAEEEMVDRVLQRYLYDRN